MSIIDYKDIEKIFSNKRYYHIGYLKGEKLVKVRNFPIKEAPVDALDKAVADVNTCGGICLIITQNRDGLNQERQADYEQCLDKLRNLPGIDTEDTIFLAKKPAVIEAGMAQYGRNQVTYDYYFGFDSQIDTYFIWNKVINLPKQNSANWDYLDICKGCGMCARACPAHAIHIESEPNWVDRDACRAFCGCGEHPRIKTVKYKLNAIFNNPPFPDSEVSKLKTEQEVEKKFNIKWEGERFYIDSKGQEYLVNADVCRECVSQPRCTKWKGNYPYNLDPEFFLLNKTNGGDYE